jgi:ribosome biogenesis GTPase
VRQFGLWSIRREDLLAHFDDLAAFGDSCRYRDCRHRNEPDCQVRAAADRGALPASRYRAYLRLLEEVSA